MARRMHRLRSTFSSLDIVRSLYGCYFVPWLALTAQYRIGRDIFDEEWDLAIILDACRTDALREVSSEYEFLGEIESAFSMGSSSKEWMVNTFRTSNLGTIDDTVYLTGNGWAEQILDDEIPFSGWTVTNGTFVEDNRFVEEVAYRPTVNESDFRAVFKQPLVDVNGIDGYPAEQLTDYAIKVGREYENSRLLVHYMQPHGPYLHHSASGEQPTEIDKDPMKALKNGCPPKQVWEAYLDNLRYVLDNVKTLLENFGGDVLITADHGEMLGKRLNGHGEGILHPKLRWVPWVWTTGTDTGTRTPDVGLPDEVSEDMETRLSALGYL